MKPPKPYKREDLEKYEEEEEAYKKYEEKKEVETGPRPEKVKEYRPKPERELEVEEKKAAVLEVRKAIIKEQFTPIEPLQFVGTKVMGDLFDRVEFLKERIDELQKMIEVRENLNQQINSDINADLEEKKKLLSTAGSREDIREMQLDMSLLKMERRKENTLFWRDIVTLKKEMRDLIEEYKMESKIVSLFSGMR